MYVYIWGDLLVDIAVEGLTVKICSGLIRARRTFVNYGVKPSWDSWSGTFSTCTQEPGQPSRVRTRSDTQSVTEYTRM